MQDLKEFDTCDFWIHIVGLSRMLHCCVGNVIGSIFGGVYEVEVCEFKRPELCYLLLHIPMAINRPLRQSVVLEVTYYDEVMTMVWYERLPHFCQF